MSVKHREIAPRCHRSGEAPLQPWQLPLPSRSLEFSEMAKNHNKPRTSHVLLSDFSMPPSHRAVCSPLDVVSLEFTMALLGQFWLHNIHSWFVHRNSLLSPWSCWLICLNLHFSLLRKDLWCQRKPNPGLREEMTPTWRSRGSPKVPQRIPRGFLVPLGKAQSPAGCSGKGQVTLQQGQFQLSIRKKLFP